jgi:hypothetical protein
MKNPKTIIDATLKSSIEQNIQELINKNPITEVVTLNKTITDAKFRLQEDAIPMYFSGNLKSKFVFIELNPASGGLLPKLENGKLVLDYNLEKNPIISDYTTYIDVFQNFGTFKANDLEKKKSKIKGFDRKQLDFFNGFGGFGFNDNRNYSFEDMKNVRNNKLQLEIVPFPSQRFTFKSFTKEYLANRFEFNEALIKAFSRDFIFMTGNKKQIEKLMHGAKFIDFKVEGREKTDLSVGFIEKNGLTYIMIPSYKNQSLHSTQMMDYGKRCKEELNKYLSSKS